MSDRVQQVEAAFREATESDIAQFVEMLPYSMDTAAADVRELVLAAVNRELMLEHERVARGEPVPWREGAPTGAEGLYLMELVPDWKPDCLPAREARAGSPTASAGAVVRAQGLLYGHGRASLRSPRPTSQVAQ